MIRHSNSGLYKRCDCPRRAWLKCPDPWHFDFYCSKTAHLYDGKPKHRYSLDVIASARSEPLPRSKSDAESLADRVRSEIRLGTFRAPNQPEAPKPEPGACLTVGDVIDHYVKRHVQAPARRLAAQRTMLWHLGVLRRTEIPAAHGQTVRFELKPIDAVTKADIEAIRDARRRAGPEALAARLQWEADAAERAKQGKPMDRPKPRLVPGVKGGEVGINRLLERARHLFAWSIVEGYIDSTPFVRGGQVVVKLTKEYQRERQLEESADERQPGEEDRLLAVCGAHLRALVVAGVATGCRVGELLGLRWSDVKIGPKGRRFLMLSAATTKTSKAREIPVGPKLAAVLDMLPRHAPDGKELPLSAYVFGNAAGERIGSSRKAWQVAVLKSHGHAPQWAKGKRNQLAPESLAAYREINLHFHDLRRTFGSRVLASGSSLVEARDLLGHANISQTSTYLQSTARALGLAIDRKEQHEREQADRHKRAAEQDCHTAVECDSVPGSVTLASDAAQVTKH